MVDVGVYGGGERSSSHRRANPLVIRTLLWSTLIIFVTIYFDNLFFAYKLVTLLGLITSCRTIASRIRLANKQVMDD